MEELHISDELRAKFQAAIADPRPGYRPVLRVIRPHFKRPPFNRTHRVLRRRHRKKDKNADHYNVGVKSYVALRWVKEDSHPQPGPDLIVDLEQLADIHPVVRPDPPEESPPPSPQDHPRDRHHAQPLKNPTHQQIISRFEAQSVGSNIFALRRNNKENSQPPKILHQAEIIDRLDAKRRPLTELSGQLPNKYRRMNNNLPPPPPGSDASLYQDDDDGEY